ncbi:tumor suppressor, Mitostatin-domain-containing protein [Zopfochytrium polystomum]|nr:tumor suppressor, Mitostatin-domain-containing protein [Zopfochytrium polystomum]
MWSLPLRSGKPSLQCAHVFATTGCKLQRAHTVKRLRDGLVVGGLSFPQIVRTQKEAQIVEFMAATSRRSIEKREAQLQKREFQREDLIKVLNQDIVFRKNLCSDERAENTRRLRNLRQRDEELKTQMALEENIRKKEERELKQREEEMVVEEIQRRREEQIREEKLRQSIRENSEELRELEKKLNYAYMNKERAIQIQQRHLFLQKERAAEAERIHEMNLQLEEQRRKELEQEQAMYERSLQYRDALQSQLADSDVRKQAEYEQFLRDKAMVDEIVQKILEEDSREQQARLEKQRETKQFIEEFMQERERWKEQERLRQVAENQRIQEYARLQIQREEEMREKRKAIDEEKNVIYDKLAAEMERQERAKAELEQLRIDLYQEEAEEKERARDQVRFLFFRLL